jgi:hypothetical protein
VHVGREHIRIKVVNLLAKIVPMVSILTAMQILVVLLVALVNTVHVQEMVIVIVHLIVRIAERGNVRYEI